jgi:hypothetical protein
LESNETISVIWDKPNIFMLIFLNVFGLGMRRIALIIIITILIYNCIGYVNAGSFAVGDSFESEHKLNYTELWNEYKITANSGKQIEYSFEVKEDGTILVLFVKGHSVNRNSDYLISYSEDNPTRSYSDSYTVDSDDGTQFTLIIMTSEDINVTYTAKIKVVDAPLTDFICGAMILLLLISCGGVAGILIRSKRKQLEVVDSKNLEDDAQKKPDFQPDPSDHECGTCYNQLSWVSQYNKWYCASCEKYE